MAEKQCISYSKFYKKTEKPNLLPEYLVPMVKNENRKNYINYSKFYKKTEKPNLMSEHLVPMVKNENQKIISTTLSSIKAWCNSA